MKEHTSAHIAFLFIAYFLISVLIGSSTSFVSQFAVSVFSALLYKIFSDTSAYYLEKMLLPAMAFALPCAILSLGQFFLTKSLETVIKDKILTFAAMCMASFFFGHAFFRYSGGSFYSMYPMCWLPCEISAFVAGITALLPDASPIQEQAEDAMPAAESPNKESSENIA